MALSTQKQRKTTLWSLSPSLLSKQNFCPLFILKANDGSTPEHDCDGAEDGAAFSWTQHSHALDFTPDRNCCWG